MTPIHGVCFSVGDHPTDRAGFEPALRLVRPFLSWGVRTYNTVGLPGIGAAAHALGLRLAAGAWIGKDHAANQAEIERLAVEARAGLVDLAVIGNEVLFRSDLPAAELIACVRAFRAAAPGVATTVGDVADFWLANPEVMDVVDLVGMHHYPYWCGIPIDDAAAHMQELHGRVKAVADAKGKPVWVLETGWPSAGNAKEAAVPSLANATRYFQEMITWSTRIEMPMFYFEAFDEPWKERDEGPQGAHWGIWTEQGEQKYWWSPSWS